MDNLEISQEQPVGVVSFSTPTPSIGAEKNNTCCVNNDSVCVVPEYKPQQNRKVSIWIPSYGLKVVSGGIEDNTSPEVLIEMVFDVTIYEDTGVKTGTIKKILKVNKDNLADELCNDIQNKKINVVEDKKEFTDERIRKLAGIPYPKK